MLNWTSHLRLCHAEMETRSLTVTSRNTLDHADSSRAVHVTSHTRHRLPASSGHLGPVPHAWNLSLQFVSLFGPLPCICFLSHLCLYEAYLFMIRFPLCPHVSPRPSVSTSIPVEFSSPVKSSYFTPKWLNWRP